MIPSINHIELKKLSSTQQRKICSCESVCSKAISLTTYNDGMMLCWNDARKFLYDLINQLGAEGYTSWTKEDEKYIIDYYKEHGSYYGIVSDLAKALGKSHQSTKSKVKRMREKGLITLKEKKGDGDND